MKTDLSSIFGRVNDDGDIDILHVEDGAVVTRIFLESGVVWPVGSDLSAEYEHPNGIVLTREDAENLGIDIEE